MHRDIREYYLEVVPSRYGAQFVAHPQPAPTNDGTERPDPEPRSLIAAWGIVLSPLALAVIALGLCL